MIAVKTIAISATNVLRINKRDPSVTSLTTPSMCLTPVSITSGTAIAME